MTFWTINGTSNEKLEGRKWQSELQVTEAWGNAGKPTSRGSSVWLTEHDGLNTVKTVTLAA